MQQSFDLKTLGQRIRLYRHRAGLTQATLAEGLNVSYQAVSGWENGLTLPDIENLCNLHLCGSDLFQFSCFPLKLTDGDGSPVRAVAWFE